MPIVELIDFSLITPRKNERGYQSSGKRDSFNPERFPGGVYGET